MLIVISIAAAAALTVVAYTRLRTHSPKLALKAYVRCGSSPPSWWSAPRLSKASSTSSPARTSRVRRRLAGYRDSYDRGYDYEDEDEP